MASTAMPVKLATRPVPLWRSLRMALTYLVLILFGLAMVMPFVYATFNSFKTPEDFNNNPQTLLPSPAESVSGTGADSQTRTRYGWSLAGYQQILTPSQIDFGRALINSIFVAISVTVLRIGLNSMAGYALARIKFPGRGLAFAALVGTMMIPGVVLLIPRFLIFKALGMIDTYTALILPTAADAFGIFLMKQFFESIPGEIEEAGEIDGASRIRMFFTVILPMAIPAITAMAIFSFQGSWNDFTGPLIALSQNDRSLFTLPLAMAVAKGVMGEALKWDLLLPSAVITTLPMAIIFFIFQRFFIEGVSYTGVKG